MRVLRKLALVWVSVVWLLTSCGNGSLSDGPGGSGPGQGGSPTRYGAEVELGDLAIPRERLAIENWLTAGVEADAFEGDPMLDDRTPDVRDGVNGWTEEAYACTGNDFAALQAVIDAAPDKRIIVLDGHCDVSRGELMLSGSSKNKNYIVLRGNGDTKLTLAADPRPKCGGPRAGLYACGGGGTRAAFPMVGDHEKGATLMTLGADPADELRMGDWVMVKHGLWTNCSGCKNRTGRHQIAKVTAIVGAEVTIDTPLADDYPAVRSPSLVRLDMRQGFGIENMAIDTKPLPEFSFRHAIGFYEVANSWVKNVVFGRFMRVGIHAEEATHLTVAHNHFREAWGNLPEMGGIGKSIPVALTKGTTESLTLDNICVGMGRCYEEEKGSSANVYAYNFSYTSENRSRGRSRCSTPDQPYGSGSAPGASGRMWFIRDSVVASLAEGNDTDCFFSLDGTWGPPMGWNTGYRNRNRGLWNGINLSKCRSGGQDCEVQMPSANFLLTSGATAAHDHFAGGLSCSQPFDLGIGSADGLGFGLWAERNTFRNCFRPRTIQNEGTCYVGEDGTCITGGDGREGGFFGQSMSAPSGWAGYDAPHSLWTTQLSAPSWWCAESVSNGGEVCDWEDVHQSVGALGDDFTNCATPGSCMARCAGDLANTLECSLDNGRGGLCKLPAQVRAEGGVCTPP